MNYLIVTREFPPQDGGIGAVAYELAKHLVLSGNKVCVIAWSFRKTKQSSYFKDERQPFLIIRLNQPRFRWLQILFLTWASFQTIRKYEIRRAIATTWNFSGVALAFLTKSLKIQFGVITHGYEVSHEALQGSDKTLLRWSLKKADRIFAVSHFTRDKVLEVAPSLKDVRVILNGVDMNKFSPDQKSQDWIERNQLTGKKVLLTVARLFERKGHDKVIEALPLIIQKVPNLIYVIAGVGPEKSRLLSLAQSLKVDQYIKFIGFVRNDELPVCYAACDVFIMPNREIHDVTDPWIGDFEGFGISFIEASSSAKPVIAGRSGGAMDAVIDGQTGIIVDPVKVREIATAAIKLLTDEKLARQLGMNGRKRVESELNWKVITQKYEKSFEH